MRPSVVACIDGMAGRRRRRLPQRDLCGAGVPYRLFLAALNKADDAATLPKDCSSRLPLSNGLSAA